MDYLEQFNNRLEQVMMSDVPIYKDIVRHILEKRGKQLRPKVALLCAGLGGELNERSYRAATIVEMLHTASLVHDDIVDDSMERRGRASVNAMFGNRKALLGGDIISIKALLLTLTNKDYDIFRIYVNAVDEIVQGELLQLRKTRKLNLDEQIYFKIIKAKTASFFSAACHSGAITTFTDPKKIESLRLFGEKVGIAFQIRDDLFGFNHSDVGKPNDNDIKEKKITLPLIYTLNNCPAKQRRKLIRIIKKESDNPEKINYLFSIVHQSGGIDYTREKMLNYCNDAKEILSNFNESGTRTELEKIVDFTAERKF
ncbi:MAG: polyprenyl synthetase family protein [Bacteroidales bacterium]|nr:polyprenyl synthetase family protein [Bacteroidales bacterium]